MTVRASVNQFADYKKAQTLVFSADTVVTLTVNRFSNANEGCQDTVFDAFTLEEMTGSVHSKSVRY